MKLALMVGLVLVLALIGGCAQKETAVATKSAVPPEKSEIVEPTVPAEEPVAEEPVADEPAPESAVEVPVADVPAPADLGVTQEELDQLKADIEGIDAEDLGGLSE
ncbi:MAG: hypothetical protein ACE5DM_04535 [Candidatus Nanoarchaeia archaeon]